MPKEKKSASCAIRSAMKHARGSSIIVPISGRTSSAPISRDHVLDPRAQDPDLLLVGDEREHDLDLRRARPCRSRTARAAVMIASTCTS